MNFLTRHKSTIIGIISYTKNVKKDFPIFIYLIGFFTFQLFLFPNFIYAQRVASEIDGCPHEFSRDLKVGSTGADVLILQRILNSDRRTLVAVDGPGSRGLESNYFGVGTREALKKFQALFYEITEIADGKFTEKTRIVAQALCNGDYLDNNRSSQNLQIKKTSGEIKIIPTGPGPQITLSANTNTITNDTEIKILIKVTKQVKEITEDSFILEGASISSIRKLSKLEYFAILNVEENTEKVMVSIEAEKVFGIDGTTNENASNEISLTINNHSDALNSKILTQSSEESSLQNVLGGILNKISGGQESKILNNSNQANPNPNKDGGGGSSGSGSGGGGKGGGGIGSIGQMLSKILGFGKDGQGGGGGGGMLGNLGKGLTQGLGGGGGANPGDSGRTLGDTTPGNTTPPEPASPSAIDTAKKAVDDACAIGQQTSQACLDAKGGLIFAQAKADTEAKSCPNDNYLSTADAIKGFKGGGVDVNAGVKLNGLPKKMSILMARLKSECNCPVRVTGGTDITQHKTHGPNKPIIDVRTIGEGSALKNYIRTKFPKTSKSASCMDYAHNVYGAVFNFEAAGCGTPEHWHVVANNFACDK